MAEQDNSEPNSRILPIFPLAANFLNMSKVISGLHGLLGVILDNAQIVGIARPVMP